MHSDPTLLVLFGELLDADAAVRALQLAELAVDRPQIHAQLVELLSCHERKMQLGVTSALREGMLSWMDAPAELAPGSRIGAYLIERQLGHGGMGVVYQARRDDDTIELRVAIKITRFRSDMLDLVRHEARLLAALSHPNIARFVDVGRFDDGTVYLLTELISGATLQARLDVNPLDEVELKRLAVELCAALAYAHARQVCHGDLKPANLMIDEGGSLRLLDFGIGVVFSASERGAPAKGYSVGYSAPEILADGQYTTAAEIYSVGRVLAETLARCSPQPRAIADWQAVIARACRPDAAARYTTINALAQDISRIDSAEVLEARRGEALHVWRRRSRKHWLALGLTATLLLGSWAATTLFYGQRNAVQMALVQADRSKATADRTLQFVLDAIAAASSEAAGEKDMTVREFAEAAGSDLAPIWQSDPDTAGYITLNLAKVDHGQERYQRVIDRVSEALQHKLDPSLETELRIRVVEALRELGRVEEARSFLHSGQWPRSTQHSWQLRQTEARLLRTEGRAAQAEALTRVTLASDLQFTSEERIALVGEMLTYVGDQGRLPEALELLEEQRRLLEPLRATRANVIARNAQNRGLVNFWLGNYSAALDALAEAKAIYRERLDPGHSSHADVAMIEVEINSRMGRLDHALERSTVALAIYEKQLGPRHFKIAEVLNSMGNTQMYLGLLDQAEASYARSAEIQALFPERKRYEAVNYYSICNVQRMQSRYGEAKGNCLQALQILQSSQSTPDTNIANALATLGQLELEAGDPGSALGHLQQAQEQTLALHGEESPELANLRVQLALAAEAVGERTQALEALQAAERVLKNLPKEQSQPGARATFLAASEKLYRSWGNHEQAQHYQVLQAQLEQEKPEPAMVAP